MAKMKYCKIKLKKANVPDSRFNKKQLLIGMKVEREHSDDPRVTKAIAKAHLSERADYYKRLKRARL